MRVESNSGVADPGASVRMLVWYYNVSRSHALSTTKVIDRLPVSGSVKRNVCVLITYVILCLSHCCRSIFGPLMTSLMTSLNAAL